MSSYDYWYNDPELFFCYMRAYEQKQKIQDSTNHALGSYVMLAFQQVMQNAFSKSNREIYPKEPFLSTTNKVVNFEDRIKDRINKINQQKKSIK